MEKNNGKLGMWIGIGLAIGAGFGVAIEGPGHMRVALRHKKCSFRFLGFACPSCFVFRLKIRELMSSLLILTCQQFALGEGEP